MKKSFALYKLIDQLFKNRFPISVLTYMRQVINPQHQTKQGYPIDNWVGLIVISVISYFFLV